MPPRSFNPVNWTSDRPGLIYRGSNEMTEMVSFKTANVADYVPTSKPTLFEWLQGRVDEICELAPF
jgi:hypothetical protein